MKYYLIAGERSGDLHASNLIKSLRGIDSSAEFRFLGGEQMQAANQGLGLYRHYQEISYMLITEVLKNLKTIFKNLDECLIDINNYQPDVIILVDFSGFNMRIAAKAKKNGFKVFYYISPKLWAWNQNRAYKVKKFVDRMFVIMPFEKAFYKKFNYEVDYVGNPILDAISSYVPNVEFKVKHGLDERPIIAILPGSRKQEITNMLSQMMTLPSQYVHYQFVIAAVSNLSDDFYKIYRDKGAKIVVDETYDLLANAYAALVTSGTATLETALFNVPQVVCYKTNWVAYQLIKRLIKVRFISLVNLIAEDKIVTELIQHNFNSVQLMSEFELITNNSDARNQVLAGYKKLQLAMGEPGASRRTASLMWQYLN